MKQWWLKGTKKENHNKDVVHDSASPPSMKVRANTILSSSSLILFKMRCSWMVLMNFSRVSRFPEKGVIFPPLISGAQTAGVGLRSISIAGIICCACWLLLLRIAVNNRSVGSGSSGGVPKLDSVRVSGVHGSGVADLLHRCSRLNSSKGRLCSTVGSPPRELLVSSCPSSELGSLGGQILHPPRVVVFSSLGVLHPEMEQGFQQLNLCYNLRSHVTISQHFSRTVIRRYLQ